MKADRRHKRHTTLMAVRFASAEHFVTEYAENLSVGGLFLRGAHTLEPLSMIRVQLDLPGFQSFEVTAKVAHVLDTETASRFGRQAGAGLQLMEVPIGFEEALMSYLARLGQRHDCLLLVEDPKAAATLQTAGYRVEKTDMSSVIDHIMGTTTVLAMVVAKGAAAMYRDAIAISPQNIPVIGCDIKVDEEALLVELDRLLFELGQAAKT